MLYLINGKRNQYKQPIIDMTIAQYAELCPLNRQAWRDWLTQHHTQTSGIWVIFYRKHSPHYNLSYVDARDEAICFGWIDSTRLKVDAERFKQYFSPRRKRSTWSFVNRTIADNLIAQGLMTPAGMQAIASAKANQCYYYGQPKHHLTIPAILQQAFQQTPQAQTLFKQLPTGRQQAHLRHLSALKTHTAQLRAANKLMQELLADDSLNPPKPSTE